MTGLHGSQIADICYFNATNSLFIVYADGKIDVLKNGRFHFISDLYNKNTTLSKRTNAITVHGGYAYMSMEFGVLQFDIRKQEFLDTYFIGDSASEVNVKGIAFFGRNIYAISDSSIYYADTADNLRDYVYWHTLPLPIDGGSITSIASDASALYVLSQGYLYKYTSTGWDVLLSNQQFANLYSHDGQLYVSNNTTTYVLNGNNITPALSSPSVAVFPDGYGDLWFACLENGVYRISSTGGTLKYTMEGPAVNSPYRLYTQAGTLYMVVGGRWASQYWRPGQVMIYRNGHWTNISRNAIAWALTDGKDVLDFMNIAQDPADENHFFATSYGTGLYEFRNDTCINRLTHGQRLIESAVPANPDHYTRLDGAVYDSVGNLWLMNSHEVSFNVIMHGANGQNYGWNILQADGSRFIYYTPMTIHIDRRNQRYKWIPSARADAGLGLLDDGGTPYDQSDDRTIFRSEWSDQEGRSVTTEGIYDIAQDEEGNIWLATRTGVIYIPGNIDYFTSSSCYRLRIPIGDGTYLLETEQVNAVAVDNLNRKWLGCSQSGIYILSADGQQVVEHYTMDNTPMPANSVTSLAYDQTNNRMFVGTGRGLVSYVPSSTGIVNAEEEDLNEISYGSMLQWSTHFAYGNISGLEQSHTTVYALTEGALFTVDKTTEEITLYSQLNGLHGTVISLIAHDDVTDQLLIFYEDGMIDILNNQGALTGISDLSLKQIDGSKTINDITFSNGIGYMAMPFGIIAFNMRKREIADTYYIGADAKSVDVKAITIHGDSLIACTDNFLYIASTKDNMLDYAFWHTAPLPKQGNIQALESFNDSLYLLVDNELWVRRSGIWNKTSTPIQFTFIRPERGRMMACNPKNGVLYLENDKYSYVDATQVLHPTMAIMDYDNRCYWVGSRDIGVIRYNWSGDIQKYLPTGPSMNMPYNMEMADNKLFVVPGGRWASQYNRDAHLMRYIDGEWTNTTHEEFYKKTGKYYFDLSHVSVDPANSNHYFVSSYGCGLIEFNGTDIQKVYSINNSPLTSSAPSSPYANRYVRIDATMYDAEGNLWITNTGEAATNMHILDSRGQWHSRNLYVNNKRVILNNVNNMFTDNRNSHLHWIVLPRADAGLVLLDDRGTPTDSTDDKILFRNYFMTQLSKPVTLSRVGCAVQDMDDDIWIGTSEGIIVLRANTDFFSSNACERIIIPRNDGTNLADYLLANEQINAIAVDGANRKWIGTASSGVYLVSADGITTIHHFTHANSPMPSNNVVSLAINSTTGEVFIGTASGLVSFRSDASSPKEDLKTAYAFPNPVRPNYEGVITITGLMDETIVNITDAAGNLVCKTRSNGGIATWDGKNVAGKRVTSGVYTALCNSADGSEHTVIKILVMH